MTGIRNYDAEFCGKVPLHQTNLIQPHGVLLIVKKDDFSILQASENCDAVFNLPAPDLVNENLSTFIDKEEAIQLNRLKESASLGKLPFRLTVRGKTFLATVDHQDALLILEIEKKPHELGSHLSFVNIYQEVKHTMAAIEACKDTEETCRVVAAELKKLSGFDKVMVYRFDEGWNGDVVAEEMEEGMESYLGLKFPASDIPKQARELYKRSAYRLIPSIHYEPVRLYPVINPLTNAFTDLSNSNLRSVAAVHLEYLQNMQVTASMSTRILKDGELWGLIACHHRTPYYLSYELCSVFELLSNFITAKISYVINRDSFYYKEAKRQLQTEVIQQVLSIGNLAAEKARLLHLLDADGIAIINNRHVETTGNTPSKLEIEDLVLWLQANNIHHLLHQPSLSSVYEAAESYAEKSSGLLALPIEADKGDFVLAFRSEAVQHIAWGGNPDEAIQFEPDTKKYHPRASFQIWQQTVRQSSIPWKTETLEVADGFRNFLIESRLNKKFKG
ncbi:MAG TPA: GAF domain-containing protein [Flavisolibacter sp.]|jgi:light-regulated signal transduction histidine kinase (bacteriophytochrome)|nr:GAF domain-containing protein [Flavisolibacter sp.]